MRHYVMFVLSFFIFCLAAEAQQAGTLDVVYLKNGNIIKGVITERIPGESVTIETRDGNVFVFTFEEIQRITREKAPVGRREAEGSRKSTVAAGNYMSKGKTYIGPSLGFSFLGTVPQFGANFESAIEDNIGVGGLVRYWYYSEDFGFGVKWAYSNILLAGQGNYHFKVDADKLDPFVGIILGYNVASTSWKGIGVVRGSVSAGGFIGTAYGGLRYFFRDNIAFVARLGYGTLSYGALDVGLDFRL